MAQSGRKSPSKILPFTPRHHFDALPTPSHLPIEEQKLWEKIASDHDIRDNTAAAILEVAMQSHARARTCREQIKRDGLLIKTQHGEMKAHPLVNAERQAHQQMLGALRRLGATLE